LFHAEDDKGFGQWVADNLLSQLGTVEITRDDRAAAMWAAANQDNFDMAPGLGIGRGQHPARR
jgi:hypothetical protein